MSTSIEQRIVEMKFDNASFSKGVDQTIKDLDNLEKATKFEGGAQSLQSLQTAADRVTFNNILQNVQSISQSLDQMQSFGFQVFENLTNKAVDWTTNMIKSLSIDQISGGFKEYELKMDSVRTIMNSSGESLDVVNKKLQELNTYSDKTIYSFSDMTASIGKFTNAGVDLDSAVAAIQGVSNEAARSGASAAEASRAMYNFSQALASGSVKLLDWRSIENANMSTVEFKQSLIDTAIAMGTVVKVGEEYKSTTTDNKGHVSDLFTATTGYNDSLATQWLTTEVLTQTLKNYAVDTREMTEEERNLWREEMMTIYKSEELVDKFEKLGQASFDAAQEVTTYSKMLDALRESVGSGWAQTFEILFGDLEEAKKLWTGVNNVIGGIIASVSDTRNGILEMWKAGGGAIYLIAAFKQVFNTLKHITEYIGLAIETLFGHRYWSNLDKVKAFFADRSGFSGNLTIIQRMSNVLVSISKKLWQITAHIGKYFNPKIKESQKRLAQIYLATQAFLVPMRAIAIVITGIASKVLPLIVKVAAIAASIVLKLVSLIGAAFTVGGVQEKLYSLARFIVNVVGKAVDFISGKIDLFWKLLNDTLLGAGLGDVTTLLGDASTYITDIFNTIADMAVGAYESLCMFADGVAQAFGFDDAEDAINQVADTIVAVLVDATMAAAGAVDALATGFESLLGILEPVGTFIEGKLTGWFESLSGMWQNDPHISKFREDVEALGESLYALFQPKEGGNENKDEERLAALLDRGYTLDKAMQKIDNMNGKFTTFGGLIDYVVGKISDFKAAIEDVGVVENFTKAWNDLFEKFKETNIGRMVANTIQPVIDIIKRVFKDFKLSDTMAEIGDSLATFASRVRTLAENAPNLKIFFMGLVEHVSKLFEKIREAGGSKLDEFLEKIEKIKEALNLKTDESEDGNFIKNFATKIRDTVKGGLSGIVEGVTTFNWGAVMSLLKGFLGLYFLKTIYDTLKAVSSVGKGVTGLSRIFKKTLKNFSGMMAAEKWNIIADSVLKVAEGIALLAGSLFILSLVPEDKLQAASAALFSLITVAAIFVVIKGAMDKAKAGADDASKTANTVKEAVIGFIDTIKGAFEKFMGLLGKAAIIVAIGVAIVLMAKVISQFATMPWGDFAKGLIMMGFVVATLIASFGLILYLAKMYDPSAKMKLGQMALLIYGFSKGVENISKVVVTFSSMDGLALLKGIIMVGLIMAEIVGIIYLIEKYTKSTASLPKIAASLLLLAFALTVLVIPVTVLALMPFHKLIQAGLGIAILLGAVFALAKGADYFKKAGVGMKEFGAAVLAVIGISVALFIFAAAIAMLVDQAEDIKKYAGVLLSVAAAFLIIVGVLAAVGYVAGPGLQMLGIGLAGIGIGLLATAAAVWVFAAAAVLLAESMDAIINAVNGREDEVTNAVSTLIFAAVKGLIDGIGYLIAAAIAGIDDTIMLIGQYLPSAIEHLGLVVGQLIGALVMAIIKMNVECFKWIGESLESYMPGVWEHIKTGLANGWHGFVAWLFAKLAGILSNLPVIGGMVSDWLLDQSEKHKEKIVEEVDETIDAAKEEIESKTDGEAVPVAESAAKRTIDAYGKPFNNPSNQLADDYMDRTEQAIRDGTPAVAEAANETGQSIVDGVDKQAEAQEASNGMLSILSQFAGGAQAEIDGTSLDFTSMYSQWADGVNVGGEEAQAQMMAMLEAQGLDISNYDFTQYGMEMPTEYAEGIASASSEPIAETEELNEEIINTMSKADTARAGKSMDNHLASGMTSNKQVVMNAAKTVSGSGATSASDQDMKNQYEAVGLNLVQGMANGMTNNSSIAEYAARQVMINAMNSAKAAAVVQSPSKKMMEIGYFLIKGLAIGIINTGRQAYEASENVMNESLATVKQAIQEMIALINDQTTEYRPVITPVLDDSEVTDGLRRLNDVISGGTRSTMRIAAVSSSLNREKNQASSGGVTNNNNNSTTFVQNNYSPKTLRRRDIYRDTKNLIALQKGARA